MISWTDGTSPEYCCRICLTVFDDIALQEHRIMTSSHLHIYYNRGYHGGQDAYQQLDY